jgi:hypothetical protein
MCVAFVITINEAKRRAFDPLNAAYSTFQMTAETLPSLPTVRCWYDF